MALTKITSTNIQPGAIESSALELSGAAAGTYGAAAKIPVLSVNAQGIVYAISEVDVAGVTGFTYNSGTEALTITTADGGSFTADISTLASQSYVDTALSNLVDTAPTTLDTLNELAAALGDDPNFATTVATSIGTKVDKINIIGATVGSASQVPVITFNAQGQITAATTTAVAGVSGTSFTNGTYTISTSDGGTYPTDFDARYFTETEAQANFLGINAKAADSDLLDGLNSTQFLRSDTSNVTTANLRLGNMKFQNANGGRIGFNRDTENGAIFDSSYAAFQINGASVGADYLAIESYNSAGSGTTTMVVTDDNLVGIGTTDPKQKLHIVGNVGIGNSSDASSSLTILSSNAGANNHGHTFQGPAIGTNDDVLFDLNRNGGAYGSFAVRFQGANRLYIPGASLANNGKAYILPPSNLGIGTTDPVEKLDVNGNIRHTGLTPTSGFDIDQIYTVTKSIQVTTDWINTGIDSSEITSAGSYMIQMYADNYDVGGQLYQEYYTGVMSWRGGTNDYHADEIVLHAAGHAENSGRLYLRTVRTYNIDGGKLLLQIKGTVATTAADNYVFKFRRMM